MYIHIYVCMYVYIYTLYVYVYIRIVKHCYCTQTGRRRSIHAKDSKSADQVERDHASASGEPGPARSIMGSTDDSPKMVVDGVRAPLAPLRKWVISPVIHRIIGVIYEVGIKNGGVSANF